MSTLREWGPDVFRWVLCFFLWPIVPWLWDKGLKVTFHSSRFLFTPPGKGRFTATSNKEFIMEWPSHVASTYVVRTEEHEVERGRVADWSLWTFNRRVDLTVSGEHRGEVFVIYEIHPLFTWVSRIVMLGFSTYVLSQLL